MRSTSVPGYQNLYPDLNETYDDLVSGIPSDIVIVALIAINSELNSADDKVYTQGRIFNIIKARFTDAQNLHLFYGFEAFHLKSKGGFDGIIFGRRYLIAMIIRELNNFREVHGYVDKPAHEFNLFKAYLKVVEEENRKDHFTVDFKALKKDPDPFKEYKILWLPLLKQYEFNNRPEIIFELYKAWIFLSYSITNYKEYLKEYLSAMKLKSAGALLASLQQISISGASEDTSGPFKKLSYIKPVPSADLTHLTSQTINSRIGEKISISDIKKYPLYLKEGRGYMVIDRDIYQKKIYNGIYFDLIKSTELKNVFSFNQYSIDLSNFMESNLLQSILTRLSANHAEVLHFDDGTSGVPDGYLRIGNKVFLFEYKAYMFPEQLAAEPDFEKFKEYIDNRFVKGKKPKGINQLKAQIIRMGSKEFAFDEGTSTDPARLKIYPILLHQDFQFSLPGINRYLNDLFDDEIKKAQIKFQVMPLVVVNLEKLMDMVVCDQDILSFEKLLIAYYKHIFNSRIIFTKNPITSNFLKWNMSFDELYATKLSQIFSVTENLAYFLKDMMESSGLSMDQLNEEL